MIKAKDILNFLTQKYPLNLGESWDRNGLFFDTDKEIKNVMITLELTSKVVNEAIILKTDLIISHHPLFTQENVNEEHDFFINEELIKKIKDNNIALIHLHTNFDRSPEGMNYQIAKRIELNNIIQDKENPYVFIGETKMGIGLEYAARVIKQRLNTPLVKYNDIYKLDTIKKIGIVAGSGYSFADEVFKKHKIDTFLTSDLKHQNWIDAAEKKYNIIDINHLAETIFVDVINNDLVEKFKDELDINKNLVTLRINLV